MEQYRTCPICTEVPEKEIYQCSSGHVICDQCLPKVSGGCCPQCRIEYGETKIRSRVLEVILDAQNFECKFKDKGCTVSTSRGEITAHANSCTFKSSTLALCVEWGIRTCNNFRVGCASRKEILSHFKNHSFHSKPTSEIMVKGSLISAWMWSSAEAGSVSSFLCGLLDPQNSEESPLFLVLGKFNQAAGFLSFLCVKVWDSESNPDKDYKAEFTFNKSSSPLFPICDSMIACGIKEASCLIKKIPVNFHMSLLRRSGFGNKRKDHLHVKISEI